MIFKTNIYHDNTLSMEPINVEITENSKNTIQEIRNRISKKEVIIFCRVSSFGQTGNMHISFEVQEEKGKNCADLFGLKIYLIVKVVESAYQGDKCTLKSLITKNRGKNIILYNVSRFCRNVNKGRELLKLALQYNVRLIFVQEGIVWDKQNHNWNEIRQHLAFCEEESRQLGKRVSDALREKRKRGFFTGGTPGYGYTTEQHFNGKKLIPEENEQEVITFINMCKETGTTIISLNKQMKKISEDYDSPILIFMDDKPTRYLEEPLSNSNIADLLNEYGVPKRNGTWSADAVGSISRRKYNQVIEGVEHIGFANNGSSNNDNNDTGFRW